MKYEKVVNGWEVKIYNPNDFEKPEGEREVLLNKKFRTIKKALSEIEDVLAPYDINISYSTLRKIGDGSYKGSKKMGECVKMERKQIKVNYEVVTTTKRKTEIINDE